MTIGNLHIGGQAHDAGLGAALKTQGRLTIRSMQSSTSVAEMAQAVSQTEDSSPEQSRGGVKENFEKNLLANLQKNKKSEEGVSSAQEFAGSISTAVDELKKQFGNEAANQAMAEILRATQGDNLTAEKIAGAFTNVLQSLTKKNTAALANENLSSAEFDAVVKSQIKLGKFLDFLNNGTAADLAPPSLNVALNDHFPSANENRFNEDFTWGNQTAAMGGVGGTGNASNSPYSPEITIDDIGRENLADFINFLRTDLESETEAQYFENLSGSADFLTEIEALSDRFYFSDPEEEVTPDWGGGITLMVRQGSGTQKAEKLANYAAYELTDLVNKTIKEDLNLRNYVASQLQPDLAAENFEFYGWRMSGPRAAMLEENHFGGQAKWELKQFEGSRVELRDKGQAAQRFAEEEMKRQGLWKDEYEGDWIAQKFFLQTLFDRGQYNGVDVGGQPFKSKEVREMEYLNHLNSGQFTPEERERAYQDFQKTNNGIMAGSYI